MNFRSLIPVFLLLLTVFIGSCSKEEIHAIESLEGEWTVTNVVSTYGEAIAGIITGFIADETIREEGQLGTFSFSEGLVDYEFTRVDTLYSGTDVSWELVHATTPAGFTNEDVFTLTVGDEYIFDVAFGDQTKNSEKDATSAHLVHIPPNPGPGVRIEITMTKN